MRCRLCFIFQKSGLEDTMNCEHALAEIHTPYGRFLFVSYHYVGTKKVTLKQFSLGVFCCGVLSFVRSVID